MAYDILRYYVGPPVMIASTAFLVQWLTLWGCDFSQEWSLYGNEYSWKVVGVTMLWAYLSLIVPGKEYLGPTTSFGYTPRYKANGLQFFIVSLSAFCYLLYKDPFIAINITYNFTHILASCNVLAFILCIYLLLKGKLAPSSSEVIPSKPFIYEFYRGMELHPRLFGVDIKQLTNCRFGLLAWELLVVNFFVASTIMNGFSWAHLVSVILQTIYLCKFYWWETGYFSTLDITLDRAGYYICWGCLVWVPSFYTFSSYYLVAHPSLVNNNAAWLIFVLGFIAIMMNYRIDWEKQHFQRYKGNCQIWGRKAMYIEARINTATGTRKSKLVTSGFWGCARHLNYVFEIIAAIAWCLPGHGYGIWPFLYAYFLTVLLVHRVFRDEEKCADKYGASWTKYCQVVPYRLIPYVI